MREEFLIVLCRLRLGILNRHLSDMFGVSEPAISKIVTTWVCMSDKVFENTLVRWPSEEELTREVPRCFKKFPQTRVIIDATELFIERPTSPSAQKATWSEYKHHDILKLLVGIFPSGAFTFVSELWTGSTSDRKITQESGLVDLLEKGDRVVAGRGFNIRDLLTKKSVSLNITPLSKGKQLSKEAWASTANITSVLIHVERAIERLKNFRIFEGNLPLSMINIAHPMVRVCAGLCNLLPPLAK